MTTALKTTTLKKSKQPHGQKTFDRLREKVTSLQRELNLNKKYLDDSLSFYYGHYQPVKTDLIHALEKHVAILFHHSKNTKLSKKEQQLLKELIEDKIHIILSYIHISDVSEDLLESYKTLTGNDLRDNYCKQFDSSMNEIKEFFRNENLDINLDHVDKFGPQDEILLSILESVKDVAPKAAEKEHDSKAKSTQELKREEKKKVLESIQGKTIGNIYKRLAKVLHPDLEHSITRKDEKVEQMKKLTLAYKQQDLSTLLKMESEWLSGTNEHIEDYTSHDLKIFNSILNEQIADLELQLEALPFQPKYIDIHPFILRNIPKTVEEIKNAIIELKATKAITAKITEDLKGQNAKKHLKEGLSIFAMSLIGDLDYLLNNVFKGTLG